MRRNPKVIALIGLGVVLAAVALVLRVLGGMDGAASVAFMLSVLAFVVSRVVDRRDRRSDRSVT